MKVVLDANVLASAFIRTGTPARLMQHFADGHFELFLSRHILRSLARAWRKPYFQRELAPERQQAIFDWLAEIANMVTPAKGIHGVADDEEDDLVLATAVAADADYLVTGDKGLLALDGFRGITIVTPRTFLDELEGEDGPERADEPATS